MVIATKAATEPTPPRAAIHHRRRFEARGPGVTLDPDLSDVSKASKVSDARMTFMAD
jgi:hypothetical protein